MVYCADWPNFGHTRVGVLVLKEGMRRLGGMGGFVGSFMVSLEAKAQL